MLKQLVVKKDLQIAGSHKKEEYVSILWGRALAISSNTNPPNSRIPLE